MRVPKVNGSAFAVAIALCALFISLGGPAWAAKTAKNVVGNKQLKRNSVTSTKIAKGGVKNSDLGTNSVSSSKLRNGVVTAPKLGAGAVTNGALADGSVTTGKLADGSVTNGKLGGNSVTSSKVQDRSLTSNDVASNTFLAANGTAQNALNANALGGFAASNFATSNAGRVTVANNGASQTLMVVSTGTYSATCPANQPTVTYANASTPVDYAEQDFTPGHAFTFDTTNNIGSNGTAPSLPSFPGSLFTATVQTASKSDARVTTAWVNGHFEAGTGCIITGQSISKG